MIKKVESNEKDFELNINLGHKIKAHSNDGLKRESLMEFDQKTVLNHRLIRKISELIIHCLSTSRSTIYHLIDNASANRPSHR